MLPKVIAPQTDMSECRFDGSSSQGARAEEQPPKGGVKEKSSGDALPIQGRQATTDARQSKEGQFPAEIVHKQSPAMQNTPMSSKDSPALIYIDFACELPPIKPETTPLQEAHLRN